MSMAGGEVPSGRLGLYYGKYYSVVSGLQIRGLGGGSERSAVWCRKRHVDYLDVKFDCTVRPVEKQVQYKTHGGALELQSTQVPT